MGVNSLPKTVTRQRRGCGFNPGPSAPESSKLTTRLPSHPLVDYIEYIAAGKPRRAQVGPQKCPFPWGIWTPQLIYRGPHA